MSNIVLSITYFYKSKNKFYNTISDNKNNNLKEYRYIQCHFSNYIQT